MECVQLKYKDVKDIREQILEEQEGICPICKKPVDKPVLDHHHKKKVGGTGLIRGVICSSCNVFIAKIENNMKRYCIQPDEISNVLRNVADYFDKEQYPYIHPTEAPKKPKLKKSSYNKLRKIHISKGTKAKLPIYPKSGNINKALLKFFDRYDLTPEYYS